MQPIRHLYRILALSGVICMVIPGFASVNDEDSPSMESTVNHSSTHNKLTLQNLDNSGVQIREQYLDFWYWMEGISLAQFMLSEEYYGDKQLELDDLKRIYTLSFTGSHVLDPMLYSLRNAYYSAASQQGEAFDLSKLEPLFIQSHQKYIDWLHKLHKTMSPYFTQKDIGKTIRVVFNDTYKNSYPESYNQYKQLLVHYSADEKPHITGEGQKRAQQWLKFEIVDELITNTEKAIYAFADLIECLSHYDSQSFSQLGQSCLKGYVQEDLPDYLESVADRPLLAKLLPDLKRRIDSIFSRSLEELYHNPKIVTEFYQNLLSLRDQNRPSFGITSIGMNFSRVEKLRGTNLNLHKISQLTLEELEMLRDDIALYRKQLVSTPVIPSILLRQLGLNN